MKLSKIILPILVVLLITSCKKEVESLPVTPGNNIADRTMQEELDFVEERAISLIENSSGYWEATFVNEVTLIYVPAGSFNMGNDALNDQVTQSYPSSPKHKVTLDHYWINKTPITIGQFRAFVEETGYVTEPEKAGHSGPWVYDFSQKGFITKYGHNWDNSFKDVINMFPEITINDEHPVNCISWNDCIAYTNWLSGKTGLIFTLPTEAEWEYAARGNDERIYPWGNEDPDGTKANYADDMFNQYFPNTEQSIVHHGVNDGYAITSPVGSFPLGKSPVGALDMAGNLTEWIYDSEYFYTTQEISNPIALSNNQIKMQKAGFWAGSAGRSGQSPNELEFGHNIRSDSRQGDTPSSADDHLGFRIAISYTDRN